MSDTVQVMALVWWIFIFFLFLLVSRAAKQHRPDSAGTRLP